MQFKQLLVLLFVVIALVSYKYFSEHGVRELHIGDIFDQKTKVQTDSNINWKTYYGGGFGLDKIITQSQKAVRISTGIDGEWYGAKADLSGIDMSDKVISFWVQVYDWNDLSRLIVSFSSDSEFKNYYSLNLKNHFAKPASKEWIEVVLDPSAFQVGEGSPDWKNIESVALRVVPVEGVMTRVWFDEFSFIDKPEKETIVSMTFDDGFASNLDMAKVMKEHNYIGTAFIIPEFLGKENYLDQAGVDTLASMGWEIGGHGKDNLIELKPVEVDTSLAEVDRYLKEKNYLGKEHFAYPNGSYNQYVESLVSAYFTSARTIDGFSQPQAKVYPSHVNAITISSSTPVTTIIDWIDQAVKDKTWLILVWHDFNSNPVRDVEYLSKDFDTVLNHLSKNNIKVLPYGQAYKEVIDADN